VATSAISDRIPPALTRPLPAPERLGEIPGQTCLLTLLRELDPTTTAMPHAPDLAGYDWIVVNISGGKDSQAMLSHVVAQASAAGVPRSRIVAVYADLGRVVWAQTRAYAEAQAGMLGVRFEVVRREKGDLLDYVLDKNTRRRAEGQTGGKAVSWPSGGARWCTSDLKAGPVTRLITRLVAETDPGRIGRRVRVLNCLGLRAEESALRARKQVFGPDPANWNTPPRAAKPGRPATRTRSATLGSPARPGVLHGRREVDRWLPIFDWTAVQVWTEIRASRLPWHWAYQYVDRLSCVMCFLSGFQQWVIGAHFNPDLAGDYHDTEIRTNTTFTSTTSMAEVITAASQLGTLTPSLPWERAIPEQRTDQSPAGGQPGPPDQSDQAGRERTGS
jgi:3'-phosphoadenosine 5'-phosphosulfate sulfotransferase (PAPS reductase)/FAD synthetase